MSEHDEGRRAFLLRAAATAGVVAGAGLAPDALARDHQRLAAASTPTLAQAHASAPGQGAFFNHEDAATIVAFTERLMPGAPGKPGATDAGVLNYIDLALAGAYESQQDFYRRGLAALDVHCRRTYSAPFVRLDAARRDEAIAALEANKATGFTWPSASAFFNTVRMHTMEGMFADPIYGGNKDFAGWRLVGFPGAQPVYTKADMESRRAFTRLPIIGLRAQAKG